MRILVPYSSKRGLCLRRNSRPNFNYSVSSDLKMSVYSDIPISSQPLYFPFTDTLISSNNNPIFDISISMTYNLADFLPSYKGVGKFFQISSTGEEINYRFRCYYDPSEIVDLSIINLYQYIYASRSWAPLDIISSDPSLRFVEVELEGGSHLISFGRKIGIITYELVPFIAFFFGTILAFAIIVLFYNQFKLNQLKRRHKLK